MSVIVTRWIRVACIVVLVFTSAGCSSMKSEPNDELISPNEAFRFRSEADRHAVEKRALAGDVQAAQLLANYYGLVVQDYEQAKKWWRVAAKNGDKSAEASIRALSGKP